MFMTYSRKKSNFISIKHGAVMLRIFGLFICMKVC